MASESTSLSLRAAVPGQGPPGHGESRSLAALGHVPEELFTLLVTEALEAVRALKVPLAFLRCARMPVLCRGFQLLGPSPRPRATWHHKRQCIGGQVFGSFAPSVSLAGVWLLRILQKRQGSLYVGCAEGHKAGAQVPAARAAAAIPEWNCSPSLCFLLYPRAQTKGCSVND
ncbi:hypothetical protein P7K49_005906 [Saguinus oedipus]|uniref:Uncharacterized protein n=1 Tax=Saguinus oedipus TaxID=9490 RepID=A0ABQ9W0W2_SAGOE|nr:hypothetical protein P7K49_005906 [Saguinus oedipus]